MNDCTTYACCVKGCGHTIHLHHDLKERLRRTHETFYCPAGHGQHFSGKTSEEKKVYQLEQRVRRFRDLWEDASAEAQDWKYRAKTCAFDCGFRSRRRLPEAITADLVMHYVDEHGAEMPVPVVEETVEA